MSTLFQDFRSFSENVAENTAAAVGPVVKASPRGVWFAVIVLVFVIGAIAFWYFRPKARDVTVMGPYILEGRGLKPKQDTIKTVFDDSQIQSSLGENFSLSFFVYMNDVNQERIPFSGQQGDCRFKPLLFLLGVGDLIIDPVHQIARLRIKPLVSGDGGIKHAPVTLIDIDNFMVAKWNQVCLTIEGRTVDVYVNGVLSKSVLLSNLPTLRPVGVLLETSPDFSGQAGLFQAWPERLTESKVAENYARNTDTRGKPRIPEGGLKFKDFMGESLCKLGFCLPKYKTASLEYVDYEYA